GSVDVTENAKDVATAIRALAPDAKAMIGMSLGGMTTIALADHAPELVRKVVLVDVTPGVNEKKSSTIAEFINGPESFDSFDDLLARTIQHQPPRESPKRGRPDSPHHPVQPDPDRIVAAARHPAQRRAARRRELGLALPALPRLRTDGPGAGRRRRGGHR